MRAIQRMDPYADIVEAPSPLDPLRTVNLGLRSQTLRQYTARALATVVAQYYGLVQEDIMLARHVFRGLKRPLNHADNMKADENVLVYTWRSLVDFEWEGTPFEGNPVQRTPPTGRVFVVLVREEDPNLEVSGSIERWNWVREDPDLPHAPVDWEQRYTKKLWSKQ